jgi:Family of unknown function (DUF6111)
MRLIEILLFVSPFAAFAVLRLVLPERGLPAWVLPTFGAAVVAMVALLLVLWGFDAGDGNQAYVPARIEGGHVIPGHAAPP